MDFLRFYSRNSELHVSILSTIGIVSHVVGYQVLEKEIEINRENLFGFTLVYLILLVVNEIVYCIAKYSAFYIKKSSNKMLFANLFIVFVYVVPGMQFLFGFYLFYDYTVENYTKTFFLMKYLILVINSFKTILIFNCAKVAADIIKALKPIFIINAILVYSSDPYVNDEENSPVVFHEIFFRYIEFHALVIAYHLIFSDNSIENEVDCKYVSISSLIGKYDSFRFTFLLIGVHYIFILITVLGYGVYYLIELSTIFIAILTINKYKQRLMDDAKIGAFALVVLNLITYLVALYLSNN